MTKNAEQKNQVAITVKNLSKKFSIPHEKISSIKIAFINLFKKNSYETFYALKNVSFEVKKGEFFGIVGRNGSGKSTLLKILAGVYTPNSGSVKTHGLISPFLELGIGFNPELSGRDNIYLNAAVLGLTEKEINEKFDSIVAFSELERFIDQKVKNYSSGMSVRLAFSVAIHANREILLMDEVLAVGDANFQAKCLREFTRYKEMGKTVILVSHDITTIQRYCDRAMLLRNGEVAMVGNAEEVCNEYLYQNMSDEEKRILKEQKRLMTEKESKELNGKDLEDEKERNNKVAEITNVEFLDKDGNVKNVFKTGNDISVKVYFTIYNDKPVINFGISLYNREKVYICSINTIHDKIATSSFLKTGFFQINFSEIGLNPNSYCVRAVVAGDNFKEVYSQVKESDYFQIFGNKNAEGVINLPHNWGERLKNNQ